jgi:hypothetical protein
LQVTTENNLFQVMVFIKEVFTVETAILAAFLLGKPYAPVLMQGNAMDLILCTSAISRLR